MSPARWVIVVVLLLVVVGMIAYARGHEHHRGNQVGALGVQVSRVGPS